MLRNNLFRVSVQKIIVGGSLALLLALGFSLLLTKQASAIPECYTSANARSAGPTVDFPRNGMAMNASVNCGSVPRVTSANQSTGMVNGTHVYLSSYYYNGSNSQSALHTPNAYFKLYSTNATRPTAQTVQVRVWWCRGGSTARAAITKGTTAIGNGTQNVSFTSADFEQIGNRWQTSMDIRVSLTSQQTLDGICKVSLHVTAGTTRVSFSSDDNPRSAATNGVPNRYNQNNWNNGSANPRRATLGPAGPGAFALKSDFDGSYRFEYALTFRPDCSITAASTIYLKVYDPDSPVDGQPAPNYGNPAGGTNNSTHNGDRYIRMGVYEYNASGTYVGFRNPTGDSDYRIRGGNDDYRQYALAVRPGYTYAWVFWNISAGNGIQMWMPFSEVTASSGFTCATDSAPTISAVADCNNRRFIINTSDPDHSGPNNYTVQRDLRTYDYNTSTWSAWSGWATIPYVAGANNSQRFYNAFGAGNDQILYQFRFRTQGVAPPGGTLGGYQQSPPVFYGPCVRGYCSLVSAPTVFYVNEPNIVTLRVYNTGENNGRTWQMNEGYQLRQISPTPVAIVGRFNTGSAVAPGSYRDFPVTITPTSVGAGVASYTWQLSRTSTYIGSSCTMTRSVIYRAPEANCTINPPAIAEEGTTGTMSMAVQFTGPSNASPSGRVTVASLSGNGAPARGPSSPALPAVITRGGTVNFDYDNFPFGNAGSATWNGSVTVTTPNGIGGDHSVNATCTRSSVVGVFPYLKEFGGDVWAGGNFINMEPSDCSPPSGSGGGIYAHNTNTNSVSSGRYVGSSAQLTVTSLLTINQFSSAGNRDENVPSGNTYSPRGLTFANNNASNTYGGGYGAAETRCITDYYNDTRDTSLGTGPFTSNLPNNAGRIQYVYNGSVINPSGALTVPNGTQAAVFVAGDVLIRNNIIYSTGANSIGQIPNFTLVVCGDIYIHSSVDRLDGLYIAQPGNVDANGRCVRDSTSTNGTIYTCATSVNNACNQNNVFSEGTNQLSINGGLIANRIKWLRIRSGASLREAEFGETPSFATGAGTNASEVINFTPQMYLAPSGLADPGTTTGGGNSEQGTSEPYDSIRSLPPVF